MRPDRSRMLSGVSRLVLAVLITWAAAAPVKADSADTRLKPYTARYQVSYRGLAGGYVESSLQPGSAPGIWLYATRAFPNFLSRIAISPAAREHSTMQITNEGVRPLEFEFNDGSAEDAKDIRLKFDWQAGRVTGLADGKPIDFEIEPGTQDTASVQKLYKAEEFDFRLEPSSAAVDRGVALATVTEGFAGKAPDLGALEVGQPVPHYGPRR